MKNRLRYVTASDGGALMGTLLSSAIAATALVYLGQAIVGSSRAGRLLRETVVAEAYGAELLEYFISQNPNRLKAYLSGFSYPLCVPINEINLNPQPLEPAIEHPDSLASIEQPKLMNAIRTYQVFVADISSPMDPDNLPLRWDICDSGATAASVVLGPTERYWIRVEVSWRSTAGVYRNIQLSGIMAGVL